MMSKMICIGFHKVRSPGPYRSCHQCYKRCLASWQHHVGRLEIHTICNANCQSMQNARAQGMPCAGRISGLFALFASLWQLLHLHGELCHEPQVGYSSQMHAVVCAINLVACRSSRRLMKQLSSSSLEYGNASDCSLLTFLFA